jgi:release factor glutamine methyltransferase
LGKDFEQRIEFHTPPDASVGFEIFLNAAPFDLIVSNPPYLSTTDEISPEVTHHEPHLALFPVHSGKHENPNYFYENFLTHARKILASDGVVFFEIPNNRAEVLRERFLKSGFRDTRLIPDLTGRPRVLQARF